MEEWVNKSYDVQLIKYSTIINKKSCINRVDNAYDRI